jgi:hypothetical protein
MLKRMNGVCSTLLGKYTALCQRVGAAQLAPSEKQARIGLLMFGVTVLALGVSMMDADAAQQGRITYNDSRITNSVNAVLLYLEGSFGALVMAAAGIGAIVAAAFGGYKAALSLMVVAVGAFILRSIMSTFFNDQNIQN